MHGATWRSLPGRAPELVLAERCIILGLPVATGRIIIVRISRDKHVAVWAIARDVILIGLQQY